MLIRSEIENLIIEAVKNTQKKGILASFDLVSDGRPMIVIDKPIEKIHGDFSCNIALRLAKILKQDPCEIATKIGDEILEISKNKKSIRRVEVVHPGFLNIFIEDSFIQNRIKDILKQKNKFGNLKTVLSAKQKKILIEFLSANPTGQLHLGHGRNAFWGDVLSNILDKAGYKVTREYYLNNAKSSNQIRELGKTALGQGESYLNDYLLAIIKSQKTKLAKFKNPIDAGYFLSGLIYKDLKKFIEKELNIKFSVWFSEEEELYRKKSVNKIYEWLKAQDLILEKEGAQWLKVSQFGDSEDRVIVRSDENKTPTYLLPDIAYHQNKIKRGFGRLINIWGADHQGHVKSMKAALRMMGFDGRFDILITQMVSLKEGEKKIKLSKRRGKIVTMKSLVDEVGLDSVRFFYLMKSLDTHMELDLDLMKEQSSKNPVFYVQYAYARINSILKKEKTAKKKSASKKIHLEMLSTESELDLIKELLRLPELIEEIAGDYQVHKLTHYAVSLADKFHHFYQNCRVLTNDQLLTEARLALIEATKITLKNTLDLLGVNAPDKM